MQQNARSKSFPIVRHQIIPSAIQGATNSSYGGDEQIYFARFNAPYASRIYIHEFCQPLLGDTQGRANSANVAAELPEIGSGLILNHPILRENLTVDIKGVLRPNLSARFSKFENV
jgi:hypothetical protein